MKRGAFVSYKVWDAMELLLGNSLEWIDVISDSAYFPNEQFDLQCALMSLPALLGMKTLEDVPRGIEIKAPYTLWGGDLPGAWDLEKVAYRRRIGICWRAEENGVSRKHRSVPVGCLEPLKAIEGVRWYSLCPKGKDLHNEGEFITPEWITDLTPTFKSWADTAAFMANMDLIISVDTAAAHLAGAMGKPTWVLAPMRSDWKLFINREDSPWYPSWRIFRQQHPLDWAETIERVAKELL